MRLSPRLSALLVPFLLWSLAPGPAHAGPNGGAYIAVHLVAATTKNPCAGLSNIDCMMRIRSGGGLYPNLYYAHVMVLRGSVSAGVGGASFGIDYNGLPQAGVDIFDWHLCGDGQSFTPTWPAPHSGNSIYWDTARHCQRSGPADNSVSASLGYFYCAGYSPDDLRITRHPVTDEATVVSCASYTDVLDDAFSYECRFSPLGWARFAATGFAGWGCPDGATFVGDLNGPETCAPFTAGNTYTFVPSPYSSLPVHWTVRGNAVIPGATDQPSVQVTTLGPGLFEIVAHPSAAAGECDARRIRVEGAVSVQGTTWSGIKGAYAPAGRGN